MKFAVEKQYQMSMRSVSRALKLDGKNDQKAAYVQYLESLQLIVNALFEDAIYLNICPATQKFIKLGQQCMERLGPIVHNFPLKSDVIASPDPNVQLQQEQFNITSPVTPSFANAPASNNASPIQFSFNSPTPTASVANQSYNVQASSVDSAVSWGSDRPASLDVQSMVDEFKSESAKDKSEQPIVQRIVHIRPLEQARQQNQRLLSAYRARIAQIGRGKKFDTTALSLQLQRKMAENVAVAEIREKALAKKTTERHRRLEEEAKRRFGSSLGMSKDEQQRRYLYTKVLEYEQDVPELLKWREKLKANAENVRDLQTLIKLILSLKDHPLSQLLLKYQYNLYNKLLPIIEKYQHRRLDQTVPVPATPEPVTTISSHNDINEEPQSLPSSTTSSDLAKLTFQKLESINFSEEFDDLFDDSGTYETDTSLDQSKSISAQSSQSQTSTSQSDLNSNQSETNANNADDTADVVQRLEMEALERHVTNTVLDVQEYLENIQIMFTVVYQELDTPPGRDMCYACVEEPFFSPIWPPLLALFRIIHNDEELLLSEILSKFSEATPKDLKISEKFQLSRPGVLQYAQPYEHAYKELRSVTRLVSPLEKLETIVRTSKIICKCVDDYYLGMGVEEPPGIGADDLLPLMAYVVIKARIPQLVSECHALEEFIHEGYLIGEEGYCLTSVQTAIKYLMTMTEGTQSPTL